MHTRPKHHLLVPSQYIGGRPRVKGMKGCGLAVGRKRVYFGVPAQTSLGEKCPTGMASHPKEVSMS